MAQVVRVALVRSTSSVARFWCREIPQQVRDYAAEHHVDTGEALEAGMHEKAEEFVEKGGEVYVPDGA